MTNFKKITTGMIAGATLMVAAAPAEAQWRGYRNRGGDRTALALGAGALGLAVGAAIGSSNRRGYYGDRGYYGGRGFGGGGGYYGRPYAYGYGRGYDRPYGYGGGFYGGGPRCFRERVFDEWSGRWRRIRVCR